MKPGTNTAPVVTPECIMLAADKGIDEASGTRRIQGEHFDIEFVRISPGETVRRTAGPTAGEEVAAVLEGTLHVESGDERYLLSVGEGIIIPPGRGSRWAASETGGLLYRVTVRTRVAAVA